MTRGKMAVWTAAVAASATLLAIAETITINPPAGTVTNTAAFVTGEDALAVNTGATGGIVHLGAYNTHTGGTTLGSGTLVLTKPVGVEETMGELGAGPFVQQGGTLRYAGPAGGTWTRAITNTASTSTGAVVWKIDNDLTMDCDVAQTVGAFVKTGPGTLTFPQPFNFGGTTAVADATRRKMMDLSPDHAPTQGHSNFTVVDGTVVIDTAPGSTAISGPVTNVLNAMGYMTIGACTTLDGTETTGVLEHRSGITRTAGNLTIGFCNGSTHNSETPLSPTLRVTGGRFLVGSGTNAIYMGVNQGVSTFTDPCSRPLLEVSSAQRLVCKGLNVGYTHGVHSTVIVRDGGYLSNGDSNVIVGNYTRYGNPIPTTNYIEVTGSGSWMSLQNFYNDNKTNGMVTTMRIADGGTVEMRNFINRVGGADRPQGELHLIVDGGVWRHRNHNNATPHIPSTVTSVKVGPGGFTTYFNGGDENYPVIFEKGIEPLDDSGTDGGLHITQGSNAMPPLRLNAANTYCGPTEISFTRVYLGKNGCLPPGTDLSVYGNSGGLIITNGIVQTVGTFTFGRDNNTDSPILGFGPNARLDVTGTFHLGYRVSSPKIHLFETQGTTVPLATAGTYTFVTTREENLDDLVRLAGCATFPLKPEGVAYVCFADTADGRARLRVTVTAGAAPAASGDPLILNNTDTATTLTATPEQIAAARAIHTNPGYASNLHGPVELGALTGFAAGGRLVSGAGLTRVSDLSFANSSSNITIMSGSLVYTGGSASIPGVTIDSAPNRAAILNVAEPDTTLTIAELNVVTGGLTKAGLGTLKIKPPPGATFTLPTDAMNNGAYNGMTALGDSPSTGIRAVNLVNGWTEIGTVGDPTDAPIIYGPRDFCIGSQSDRAGVSNQTAGALRMNNGSLNVDGNFFVGYYCGNYASNPDLNLLPTLEQNGGLIICNELRFGQCDNTAKEQTDSPCYFLHGGTNIVRDTLYSAYSAVTNANTYRTTIDVDGGLLVVSNNFICGNAGLAMGTDVSIRGNGRVEVGGIFYAAYASTRESNTFTLTENGVLRAQSIDGYNAARGLVATFDGGTFESALPPSGYGYIRRMKCARIGAGGLNIDLSQHAELGTHNTNWLVAQQAFEHDPDCAGVDGGITVRGAGALMASIGFEEGTFTGPIRVLDGARLAPSGTRVARFTVQVAPGAGLRDYSGTSVVNNLTLGENGATDPVVLELFGTSKTTGFTATNSLQVLSPVAVTMIQEAHDFQPRLVTGVYTALVYNASCPDVDLSLFRLTDADAQAATLTAAQTTIDGGDFDGMKAVVVTVTARNGAGLLIGNVWTSVTSGGNWSTAANWENPNSVPNGISQDVSFNPATAAGVGVTLDAPVTVGSLTFNASSATSGYTLSGSPLTIDGGSYFSPFVNNASGTNAIAVPLTLGKDTQFRTTAGNELRVTGGMSGSGNLNVNTHVTAGAGQVNLKVDPSYSGKITTGSGRVVVDNLSFVQAADQLVLGRGTFLYTGPDVEIPGFQVNAGKGRQAIFESEADVTVTDSISCAGTSAFAKYGSGTLRLHGTGTFALNTSNTDGGTETSRSRFANGDGPTNIVHSFAVSSGTVVLGELDDETNAPKLTTSSTTGIGTPTSTGDATLVLNNGTVSSGSHFYLGQNFTTTFSTPIQFTYRQNGGSLSIENALVFGISGAGSANKLFELNGGTVWVKTNIRMARSASTSTLQDRIVINGGHLAAVSEIQLAYESNASRSLVEINGGTLTCSNTFYAARSSKNVTTTRLNPGGTFRCEKFSASHGSSTTYFYGNGGEYRPLGLTASTLTFPANAFTYLYASTNGLVLNTEELSAGNTYAFAQAILTDPACNGADGGLMKRGAGTLALTGANTYTGTTVVEGGILALSGTGSLGMGSALLVARGAICDLGGTAQAVGDVTTSGLVRNGTLTVGGALVATGTDLLTVDGDFAFANTAAVDFAAVSDADLSAGVPLAAVSGTATLPARARALNAGTVRSVTLMQADHMVYAVPAPNGTMVIVR